MTINLADVRDLLQPGLSWIDGKAKLTVDYVGDRLLLDGKPYFSRQDIDDNVYKTELIPRALTVLGIDKDEYDKRRKFYWGR